MKIKVEIDRGKEARRASRAVLGNARNRKRGAHRVARRPQTNELTPEEEKEARMLSPVDADDEDL